MTNHAEITTAVKQFFGNQRVCYATPGSDNHSANFYGDRYLCRFTRDEVIACIETARDNWDWSDSDDPTAAAIAAVLADLQFARPE